MARSTPNDPTKTPILREIRERYEYAKNQWADIRKEAALDMQYVKGQPFSVDELNEREDRPTIAPEEMSQYRNQVTNALRGNPRGVKFQPAGGGASKQTAELYQDKMREIEYRCHAVEAYIGGAENVLQRSYGYWRINKEYENPRSPNLQLSIEGFPDPDVVLMDPDAKRRTSEDATFGFVKEQMPRTEFKRKYKGAKVTNFSDYVGRRDYGDWVIGAKDVQVAQYWTVEKKPRKLFAVMVSMQQPGQPPVLSPKPMFVFEDEIPAIAKQVGRGVRIVSQREVRNVDYPEVFLRVTNGLEELSKEKWDGKYIPIVSIYGPILYVPEGGEVKKTILSMTRFGRDPWKAYCYASSQELEVLGMVPHGSVVAVEGQLADHEDDWEDALHKPKLVLYYKNRLPGMPADAANLERPTRLEYTQGEYLQAIEMVKEGFRRAIQAAMGSNFLPTQAQRINDKSGEALKKIDEAATQGTYHFVDAYEDGIRHTGVIIEDLIDKIHDYAGETPVMNGKLEARNQAINDPQNPDAVSTRGDHLVTVTTAPSSDSEFDAVDTFLQHLITNLQEIAAVSGPKVAAAVLALSIKMRNMGVMGDEIANLLSPPDPNSQDGKPVDPRLQQKDQQIQQLQEQLQQLGMVVHTKQVEGHIKYSIEKMKVAATSADKAADRAVKLDVAALTAGLETLAMFVEEQKRLGGLSDAAAQRLEDGHQATMDRGHDALERVKDRLHERHTQMADHTAAAAQQAAGGVQEMAGRAQQGEIDAAQAKQAADAAASGGGGQ